jgi:LPXTG-motif cell wall-anchored protein
VEIVISATHAETNATGSAAQVTMEAATKNMSNTVVDTSGSTLPSTGGMGTILFYTVGGIMVIGAGVVLVTKKRSKNEQ